MKKCASQAHLLGKCKGNSKNKILQEYLPQRTREPGGWSRVSEQENLITEVKKGDSGPDHTGT